MKIIQNDAETHIRFRFLSLLTSSQNDFFSLFFVSFVGFVYLSRLHIKHICKRFTHLFSTCVRNRPVACLILKAFLGRWCVVDRVNECQHRRRLNAHRLRVENENQRHKFYLVFGIWLEWMSCEWQAIRHIYSLSDWNVSRFHIHREIERKILHINIGCRCRLYLCCVCECVCALLLGTKFWRSAVFTDCNFISCIIISSTKKFWEMIPHSLRWKHQGNCHFRMISSSECATQRNDGKSVKMSISYDEHS